MDPIVIVQDRLVELARATVEAGPRIAAALALILATWGAAHLARWLARRLAGRAGARRGLADVFAMLAGAGVWIAGLLLAATIAFPSITPGKLLTALGLGSVAIGFAFKDIFENFFAGILILVRRPFDIGDHVAADEVEGRIEEITVRDTRIRRTDGQLVVVPNAELFQNPVTVRTNAELRRTAILCGVGYDEDADAARAVIEGAVRRVDSVRDDVRDVQVFAKGFGPSSVDFEVAWWTGSAPVDIRASRDEVVRAVKRALDEAGIEIPFPQRTLSFKGAAPVALSRDADAREGGREGGREDGGERGQAA